MSDANDTIAKVFSPEAARFLALEFTDPPATALVEVRRADHSGFETTRVPTHCDVVVFSDNGGSADIRDLDLKQLGAEGLLDVIARTLPQAHVSGIKGDHAALLGQMIVNAAAARHVSRNFEAA